MIYIFTGNKHKKYKEIVAKLFLDKTNLLNEIIKDFFDRRRFENFGNRS